MRHNDPPRTRRRYQLVLLGIGLAAVYWILESTVDAVAFRQGPLLARLVSPGLHEVCIRIPMVVLLVAFSVYAQNLVARRNRVEWALRERERRYRVLTAAAPVGIFHTDAEGSCQFVNERGCQITGLTPQEASGDGWVRALHPDDRERIVSAWRTSTRNRQPFKSEHRYVRPDGTTTWVFAQAAVETDDDGRVIGYIGTITDITERKQGEADLLETKQRLHHLLSSSPAVVYSCGRGPDFPTTFISENVAAQLGYEPRTFLEDPFFWTKQIHPDDRDRVLSELARVDQGEAVGYDYRFRHKNGHDVWLHDEAVPLFDEAGSVYGLTGSWHDITLRKRIEEALRESEQRYRAIVEGQTDLICRWTPDGTLTFVNEAYCRYFGKTREELIGGSFMSLIPEQDYDRVMGHFSSLGPNNSIATHEHRVIRADGTIGWQHWTNRTIVDEQGNVVEFQAVGRDITERKEAEEALRSERDFLARLLELTRSQLSEPRDFCDHIVNAMADRLDTSMACISEIQGDSQRVVSLWDHGQVVHDRVMPLEGTPCRNVLRDRHECSLRGPLAEQFPNDACFQERPLRCFAGVPIFSHTGNVLGVATVLSEDDREFTPAELLQLRLFGQIAGAFLERHRAESELRESQRALSTLLSNLPGMAYRCQRDPTWTMEFVSEGCYELTGYHPDDLVGNRTMAFVDVIHPDDRQSVSDEDQEALARHEPFRLVYRIITASGDEKWVWEQGRGVFAPTGELLALEGFIADITERKRAEEQLRAERDFTETLVQASPAFFVAIGADGRTKMMNRAMLSALGYAENEVVGADYLRTFVPEADRPMLSRIFERLVENWEPTLSENRVLTRDGRELLVEWHGRPVFKEDGALDYFFGVGTDITERKQTQERLHLLSSAVEQSTEGIAVADLDGNLLFVNDAFAAMHGYRPAELIGGHLSVFHAPEQLPTVDEANQQLLKTGTFAGEILHLRRDGTSFPAAMHNSLLRDETGNPIGMIGTLRDITERKQAEEELARYRDRLEELVATRTAELTAANEKLLESQARLAGILASLHECAIVTEDRNGILTDFWVPLALQERYGIPASEAVGKSVREFLSRDLAEQRMAQIRSVFETGESLRTENAFRCPGGEFWHDISICPLRDPSGNVSSVIEFVRDITDRKAAEQALVESEKKYRTLVENLPQRIFYKNSDSVYVSCNRNYARDCQIDPDEIKGMTDYDFYPRELADKYRADDRRVRESGKTEEFEERYIRQGQELIVRTVKTPVKDEQGNIVGTLGIFWDITERKQAEEELREKTRKVEETASLLTSIVNCTPDLIFVKDRNLRTMMCNEALARAAGRSPEELIGHTDIENGWDPELVHGNPEKGIRGFENDDRDALAGRAVRNPEDPANIGDEIRVFDTRKLPLRNAEGEIFGVLGVARDITDSKRAEQALRDSEERHRAITESAQDAIITSDAEGHVRFWNPAAEKIFGYTADEVLNRNMMDLIVPPRYHQAKRRGLAEFARTGRGNVIGKTLELTALRKDGTEFPISISVSGYKDRHGFVGLALVRDITDQKRVDEELRQARADLEVRVVERTKELSQANESLRREVAERRRAEEALRYRVEFDKLITALSTHFINLAPEEIDAEIDHALQEIGRFAEVDRAYIFQYSDNGDRMSNTHEWCAESIERQAPRLESLSVASFPWFQSTMRRHEVLHVPRVADLPPQASAEKREFQLENIQSLVNVPMVYGGTLVGFLGFDSVRTEKQWPEEIIALLRIVGGTLVNALQRKRAEEERRRLEEQLLQAQKMESVGRLAAGIAHDFNNLLQSIVGNLSNATERVPRDHEATPHLERIEEAARRGKDHVDSLLMFARQIPMKRLPIDLNRIVRETADFLRPIVPDNIELPDPDAEKDLPNILADAGQMRQVVMNLCVNALEAMPDGGRITIETKTAHWPASDAARAGSERAAVRLTVRDSGCGMDDETRARAFEPFFSTKTGPGQGTGLGLSIVYGIVKDHGGDMSIRSEPGKGTCVEVLFLVAGEDRSPAVEPEVTHDERPVTLPKHAVLLAEDEALVLNANRTFLTSAGLEVVVAENGAEALQTFLAQPARFSAVVLDHKMPRMSGLDCLRAIRQQDPQVPVIFTTGYLTSDLHDACKQFGNVDVLEKPFRPAELLNRIARLVEKQRASP